MLLVDSSGWIDFFNGNPTPQTLYLLDEVNRHEILLGDLMLYQLKSQKFSEMVSSEKE